MSPASVSDISEDVGTDTTHHMLLSIMACEDALRRTLFVHPHSVLDRVQGKEWTLTCGRCFAHTGFSMKQYDAAFAWKESHQPGNAISICKTLTLSAD